MDKGGSAVDKRGDYVPRDGMRMRWLDLNLNIVSWHALACALMYTWRQEGVTLDMCRWRFIGTAWQALELLGLITTEFEEILVSYNWIRTGI